MSDRHLAEAIILLQQRRPKEAEEALRQTLASDPQDARAHSLLALALTSQERYAEAEREARAGVSLKPDASQSYYALARALRGAARPDDALHAIQEAIRLDPEDADYYGVLSSIYTTKSQWQKAREAAEEGLRRDPEHVECTNLQALALVQLGRKAEAGRTLRTALARDPENAMTHANQGWALLHANQPQQAMEHFREALRLDPDLEWARAGIVEALKARNPIYRVMLAYFLWMSRLSTVQQWAVILGGYFAIRLARGLMRENPSLTPVLMPVVVLYFVFVVVAWTAHPLFDLLLRLDRFGRLALSREQIVASNWIGACILAALILLGLALPFGGDSQTAVLYASGGSLAMMLPVAGVFQSDSKRNRIILAAYSAALAALVGLSLALSLATDYSAGRLLFGLFILGWIVYTWVANILISTE